jgi:hypothetical protein
VSEQKWYRQPEMLVGLSAVLVSFVALGVGIYSAYIDRQSAHAAVWPSVMIAQSHSDSTYRLMVLNQGTGPAIIKYARLSHNGKPLKSWRDWLAVAEEPNTSYVQSHLGGGVIRSGQEVVGFEIDNALLKPKIMTLMQASKLEICYCSVFDTCWVSDSVKPAREVGGCDIAEHERFLQ